MLTLRGLPAEPRRPAPPPPNIPEGFVTAPGNALFPEGFAAGVDPADVAFAALPAGEPRATRSLSPRCQAAEPAAPRMTMTIRALDNGVSLTMRDSSSGR